MTRRAPPRRRQLSPPVPIYWSSVVPYPPRPTVLRPPLPLPRQSKEPEAAIADRSPRVARGARVILPGMPLPPTLSPEQRQAALDKAAAARRQRAELKEKLKMGSLSLKELLDQAGSDDVVGKMKMLAVL